MHASKLFIQRQQEKGKTKVYNEYLSHLISQIIKLQR